MRHERQPIDAVTEARGYTFHFQITNKGGRQACSVEVLAPSACDATTFVRQNWPLIESKAREQLERDINVEGAVAGRLFIPLVFHRSGT